MRLLKSLACISGFTCISLVAQAACTSSTCADFSIQTYVSTSGSSSIESPVIIYKGSWAGAWGGAINFPAFAAQDPTPSAINYAVTFGTLDITGVNSLQINSTSANSPAGGYYALKDATGDTIPYTVSYTGCDSSVANNTQYITPNPGSSDTLPAAYVLSSVGMAGANPPCHPNLLGTQPGQGSGELTFNLVRPVGVAEFAEGDYQDTLHVTICTQGSVCN